MIGIFYLLLVCFGVLSVLYVRSSGKLELARLFDLPVYVTALMLVSFGLAPLQSLWNPDKLNDNLNGDTSLLVTAFALVIVGMMAFWGGCKLVEKKSRGPRLLPSKHRGHGRVLMVAVILYAVGFAAKIYLLGAHMFAYTADLRTYYDNLADAQVFTFLSQFAMIALLMLSIEKFSDPANRAAQWLFWAVFLSECAWGLISGMKGTLLANFVAVALVSTILHGKLAWKWLVAVVVGIVILYPFINAYRDVLNEQSASQVADFGGAAQALSFAAAMGDQESGNSSEWVQSGSDKTVSRLDLLQSFALVLSFGDRAAEIHGDEEIWMIPFYPFVPRLAWESKPILSDASRFSQFLGSNAGTSTAVTYAADCYIYGGLAGLMGGMFLIGVFAQFFTNTIRGEVSKYQLFKYSVLFFSLYRIEVGAFEFWTGFLKIVPTILVIGWLAYGSLKPGTSPVVPRRMPVPQRT
jgi:hypothetical protein